MAVQIVGEISNTNKAELNGYSTDIKPLEYATGSTFYEYDTTKGFIFDGEKWWLV